MSWRSLYALLSVILLAGCVDTAHPIIIETPVASATPYVTPAPTVRPTHTPAPTHAPRVTTTPDALSPANKININEADADTLANLPHIGPTLAQRIITYRQAHGSFKSIADIRNVKGIGDAIFAMIRDYITVGN